MPLFWLSLAFLAGLLPGRAILFPWWAWAGLALAAVGLALLERRRGRPLPGTGRIRALTGLPAGILLAAALLGLARQAGARPQFGPAELAFYNDRGLFQLSGVVVEPPDAGRLVVAVDELAALDGAGQAGPPQSVAGRLEVIPLPGSGAAYGDRLSLEGNPLSPAAQGAARAEYLAQQSIYTTLRYPRLRIMGGGEGSPLQALLYSIRQDARRTIQQILPMPESALLTGILLGIDSDLPEEVAGAFRDTGTAHIWAISGFNIAILAGLALAFISRLLPGRRLAASLLAVALISLYTLLVGASPSVVRAAIMGGVGTFGRLLGRRQTGLNSLTFTAALMCAFEPLLPWSISFQLSFLATAGLVAFGEPLQDRTQAWLTRRLGPAWAGRIGGPLADYVLLTLAAQLATLPVTAVNFGRISLSAILANPLVLPIQPAVMILGGLALLGGWLALPLGQVLGLLAWPGLAYTIRTAELLAGIPGGVLVGEMAPGLALAIYTGLILLALGLHRPGSWIGRLKAGTILLGLALLAGTAWRGVFSIPDGRLHLLAVESGGPPAVLLRTPSGQFIGINGGSQVSGLSNELGRRLPPFTSSLEAWLITASSPSPLEGLLELSGRFSPRRVFVAARQAGSSARAALLDRLQQAGAEVSSLSAGQVLQTADGVRLSLLADTPDGAALLVEYGSFRALLPGGAPQEALPGSVTAPGAILILSPADLETLTPADWQQLSPAGAAWSRRGPEIDLPAWESLPRRGWVEFSSDGTQLWIEAGP